MNEKLPWYTEWGGIFMPWEDAVGNSIIMALVLGAIWVFGFLFFVIVKLVLLPFQRAKEGETPDAAVPAPKPLEVGPIGTAIFLVFGLYVGFFFFGMIGKEITASADSGLVIGGFGSILGGLLAVKALNLLAGGATGKQSVESSRKTTFPLVWALVFLVGGLTGGQLMLDAFNNGEWLKGLLIVGIVVFLLLVVLPQLTRVRVKK